LSSEIPQNTLNAIIILMSSSSNAVDHFGDADDLPAVVVDRNFQQRARLEARLGVDRFVEARVRDFHDLAGRRGVADDAARDRDGDRLVEAAAEARDELLPLESTRKREHCSVLSSTHERCMIVGMRTPTSRTPLSISATSMSARRRIAKSLPTASSVVRGREIIDAIDSSCILNRSPPALPRTTTATVRNGLRLASDQPEAFMTSSNCRDAPVRTALLCVARRPPAPFDVARNHAGARLALPELGGAAAEVVDEAAKKLREDTRRPLALRCRCQTRFPMDEKEIAFSWAVQALAKALSTCQTLNSLSGFLNAEKRRAR
jgi:hypothetical protein